MLDDVSIVLIGYFYLAFTVFVVGTLYVLLRWIFLSRGPTGTYLGFPDLATYPEQESYGRAFLNILKRVFLFSSMKYDKTMRAMSLLFHWSLWIILAVHLDIVLQPYVISWGTSFGFSRDFVTSTIDNGSFYGGAILAVLLLVSGAYLIYRRVADPYLRRISTAGDYFAISLIMAFGVTGGVQRFFLPLDVDSKVGPFVVSLFSTAPQAFPDLTPIFALHYLLACTLALYIPFSKFLHPASFVTNPTLHAIWGQGREEGA